MAKVVEDSLMDRVRVDPVTLCMGTSSTVLRKATAACFMWLRGHVLREKVTLGKARQERSRVISISESSKSGSLDKPSLTFSTL